MENLDLFQRLQRLSTTVDTSRSKDTDVVIRRSTGIGAVDAAPAAAAAPAGVALPLPAASNVGLLDQDICTYRIHQDCRL